jgi:hypothetical protein
VCVRLKYLNLSQNQHLSQISWEAPLPQLRYLDLSECGLTELCLPAGCDRLEKAWLQGCGLKRLSFNGPCRNLELLDASNNNLSALTLPAGFNFLAHLYLVDNGLQQLGFENPGAAGGRPLTAESPMPCLETLHLSGNRLKKVPENIIFSPKLTALYLGGNAPKNIPKVFLGEVSEYSARDCLADARTWFSELKGYPSEKNRVVKLMFTGNSNVGKTTLACALKHGFCDHDCSTTQGILVDTLEKNPGTPDAITYNRWDFGGQEVYHGTHRLFMGSKALQVMVFDRLTEDDANADKKVPDRAGKKLINVHPMEYWYETVKQISPNSLFFFIQNRKNPDDPVNETIRGWEPDRGRFICLNARTGRDVDDLLYFLKKRAPELPDFDMTMPASWLRVRQFFIDNLEQTDNKKIISKEAFNRLCDDPDSPVMEKARPLLFKYLHHNGFLYYHEHLGDSIIADQRWALEAIYRPYDRKADHYKEFEGHEGKIHVSRLFQVFGSGYTENEKWLFLDFMKSCGLCFPLNHRPWEQERSLYDIYVFPEFLPEGEPERLKTRWERAKEVHVLRYRLPWINYYVIQSFITAIGRKTEVGNFWRYGIHVETDEGWFKAALDYERKALQVFIEKDAMAKWLGPILEELRLEHGRDGWEISRDMVNFESFNPEDLKAPDRYKVPDAYPETGEKDGQKGLTEKLVDKDQTLRYILLLAANPTEEKLSLRPEHSHIDEKLKGENLTYNFEVRPVFGATVGKMMEQIDERPPTAVHFCGHGQEAGPDCESKNDAGLVFHLDDYQGQEIIGEQRLEKMFKRIKEAFPELKVVFLNACHSAPLAKAISRAGVYALGSDDELASAAARPLAAAFYQKYAQCLDVEASARFAVTRATGKDPDMDQHIHLFLNGEEDPI